MGKNKFNNVNEAYEAKFNKEKQEEIIQEQPKEEILDSENVVAEPLSVMAETEQKVKEILSAELEAKENKVEPIIDTSITEPIVKEAKETLVVDKELFYRLMVSSVKGNPFRGHAAVSKFAEVIGINNGHDAIKFWQTEVQPYLGIV